MYLFLIIYYFIKNEIIIDNNVNSRKDSESAHMLIKIEFDRAER